MSLSSRAGLVLLHDQPGAQEQLARMIPGLRHPGPQPEPVPVRRADQLQLVGVEAEIVEPPQPLRDPVPLVVRAQQLFPGQLIPEPLVPPRQLRGDLQRIQVRAEQLTGLEVEELAVHTFLGELHVVTPLARGQRGMALAGLRVDQIRLERARVVAEQRVGQRAVTPEETAQVQPHQELDQGVEQPVRRLAAPRAGKQSPVRGGVVQEPGDQDRLEIRPAVHHDAHHMHRRHVEFGQLAQQPVFAPGQVLVDGLERVQLTVVGHEADDVPGDAALPDLDQARITPLRERLRPRQAQQAGRVLGGRAEDETHG